MTAAAIALATLRFAVWELALFAAAIRLAGLLGWHEDKPPEERWLAILSIQLTLESSFAALFSFAGWNSQAAYWLVAVMLLAAFARPNVRPPLPGHKSGMFPFLAALLAPLVFLSFKPVEEIDSINYLHYLIDWMANRATPYTFATNYVAFWELSFLPVWSVTGVDLFFPLLALKAIALMAAALWLVGREIGWDGPALMWTIAGALAMRHYWIEFS